MKIKSTRDKNGKLKKHLSKEAIQIIGGFHCRKTNMFIIEKQKNNLSKEPLRKFVISMRLDGNNQNNHEFKMAQMDFNEEELIQLKEQIEDILSNR
ncbi:hypothetical protein [Bacillus sp. NPDC094106]|uniref:hypothetical protein n=1 Tax=Bacillus sp. NPDC094106 TaxID=3363949 RepID=UPI003830BE43